MAGTQLLREAATMHRALGDRSGLLHALNNLAEREYGAGHAEQAVEIAREAVEIGMNNKDRPAVMLTRSNLAGYLLALGEVDEAEQAAKESLRDERSVGGRSNYVAWTMHHWRWLRPSAGSSSAPRACSATSTLGTRRARNSIATSTSRHRTIARQRSSPRHWPRKSAPASWPKALPGQKTRQRRKRSRSESGGRPRNRAR